MNKYRFRTEHLTNFPRFFSRLSGYLKSKERFGSREAKAMTFDPRAIATVSLPMSLRVAARKAGLSLSKVLQEAIRERLRQEERT